MLSLHIRRAIVISQGRNPAWDVPVPVLRPYADLAAAPRVDTLNS